jgi:adenosine kinase
MTKEKGCTGLLGSVGDDFYGDLYAELCKEENILPVFEKFDVNTGVCCVFCYNRDRGHVTDLGASTLVSNEFAYRMVEEMHSLELIYTELFILKHRPDIVQKLAEIGSADDKIFGFNLPSFYFIQTFLTDILGLLEFTDIVFSNLAEAKFLGELLNLDESILNDLPELCKTLVMIPKRNSNKKRVVVITCGPDPAYITEYDFNKAEVTYAAMYPPKYVDENLIVDTNGAGDAFAGGFLSKFVQKKPLDECVMAGHWAASIIIQNRGCQIPKQNC